MEYFVALRQIMNVLKKQRACVPDGPRGPMIVDSSFETNVIAFV